MHRFVTFCFIVAVASLADSASAANGWASSNRKPQFIDHIHHLIKQLANTPPMKETTAKPAATLAAASAVVAPVATTKKPRSAIASSLMQTIAPPAVRPCFVRPAFCPATSDACSRSRCARIYANGVRIGSRYYKRVKCRLNYCRETCGKAEWFADGRRLVGCSDTSSTIDSAVWSMVPKKGRRLDSRVLPKERTANAVRIPENGMGVGGMRFDDVKTSNLKRRSLHEFFGGIGETLKNHTQSLGVALQDTFANLNADRAEKAVSAAKNETFVSNLTEFVDKQLDDAMSRSSKVEAEVQQAASEAKSSSSTSSSSKTIHDVWLVMMLVGSLMMM